MEQFIPVTEENKKQLLIKGRVVWVIKKLHGTIWEVKGFFDIRPALKKGWVKITNWPPMKEEHRMFIFTPDEGPFLKSVVELGMKEKSLYIRLSDKLVTYEPEN